MTETGERGGTLENAVHALLDGGGAPDLLLQPIVDLRRGLTVGYEVLSRFPGPTQATPDRWFDAALRVGRAEELEVRVVSAALKIRESLPRGSFLSVNVAPEALLDSNMQDLLRRSSLEQIVFELTEHSQVTDYGVLTQAVRDVRALGAFVAVDDAGAGYASLAHILELRPDFVKLDRSLISGIQKDDAKAALVEMFGCFTGRIDAWLLAEGIEEHEELQRLIQLGIPLGQGYLLGKPQPAPAQLARSLSAKIRASVPRQEALTVARFVERCEVRWLDDSPQTAPHRMRSHLPWIIELHDTGRPSGLLRREDPHAEPRPALCVIDGTPALDALKRALTRPEVNRFDPIVCCKEDGSYFGVVRIERLVEQLLFPPLRKPSYHDLRPVSVSPPSSTSSEAAG